VAQKRPRSGRQSPQTCPLPRPPVPEAQNRCASPCPAMSRAKRRRAAALVHLPADAPADRRSAHRARPAMGSARGLAALQSPPAMARLTRAGERSFRKFKAALSAGRLPRLPGIAERQGAKATLPSPLPACSEIACSLNGASSGPDIAVAERPQIGLEARHSLRRIGDRLPCREGACFPAGTTSSLPSGSSPATRPTANRSSALASRIAGKSAPMSIRKKLWMVRPRGLPQRHRRG